VIDGNQTPQPAVHYDLFGNEGLEVKKEQLARRLARESGITPAAAADQLDRILNDILKRVRRGQSVSLPGLGTFSPGPKPEFYFEQGLPHGAQRFKPKKPSR
jgi:Bacterial DNA-binding protein